MSEIIQVEVFNEKEKECKSIDIAVGEKLNEKTAGCSCKNQKITPNQCDKIGEIIK